VISAVVVRFLTIASALRHRKGANQGHNGELTPTLTRKADSTMWNAGLQFGVLGPLQLLADGNPIPLGAPKQRAVLAMLVMNRNRPVSVDALINAVWDHSPVPAARTSIHSYVSNLRRLIGGAGHDPNKVLASAPPGYQLSVPDSGCDLGRFITEKNAGVHAAAAGRFEDAAAHLAAALSEWRGPVLDDLREFGFVDTFATALSEVKVVAQIGLAEAEIACGRADTVIVRLEALAGEHPYREPLWAQLITAYYVAERQSDALDAYRRLKANLAENLGIDPGPTLRTLHERILRQEPLDTKHTAQTTAMNSVVDLGPRTDTKAGRSVIAELRGNDGRRHRLEATTRIGRRPDNDIVLDDDDVSRYHAVIIDTGGSFVISDLRSTNGVQVEGRRIRASATLADGNHVRIGGHEFTFAISAG
jgi:SARP family transcriptional regulator, regulator of embCAB operon